MIPSSPSFELICCCCCDLDRMNRTVFPLLVTLFVTASIATANPGTRRDLAGISRPCDERRCAWYFCSGKVVGHRERPTGRWRWQGSGWSSPIVWGEHGRPDVGISGKPFKQPTPGIYGNDYIAELQSQGLSSEEVHAPVARPRQRDCRRKSTTIRYVVYALDAAHRQDQMGAGGAQGLAAPAAGTARIRTRPKRRSLTASGIYVSFGGERRALLLRARRHSCSGRHLAAAADLSRLRDGLVARPCTDGRVYLLHDSGRRLGASRRSTGEDRMRQCGARARTPYRVGPR